MAFDGIVVANLVRDLSEKLINARIQKIAQPEKDELLLTLKGSRESFRLLISANASLPLMYFTKAGRTAPLTAPNFCMLLRKYISNGRIVSIKQPGLERIVRFEIEHLDDMGDLKRKYLIVELMGKHSNIIFTDDKDMIIDSIKHISANISSVREVLPGRDYFIPNTAGKHDPLTISEEDFISIVGSTPAPLSKALYLNLTGLSPVVSEEICHLATLDSDISAREYGDRELSHLYHAFTWVMDDVKSGNFTPNIIYEGDSPVEFASVPLTMMEGGDYHAVKYDSVSELLEHYYSEKDEISRIRQKSSDLRKVISNCLERAYRKLDIQEKQLSDTEGRDMYRIYGELLNTYGYGLSGGEDKLTCVNYYDNEEITIPLDPTMTASENSKRYFEKYNKQKRTYEATLKQLEETRAEIDHLESINTSMDIAREEADLVQIREELMEYGYIKRRGPKDKKPQAKSRPYHYVSDGFDIYVGKNNYQNEEVTFKIADNDDWWFHAKKIPGSHVIVKTNGRELPDHVFEEAASLAAYYSKGRENDKVEIDYVKKKALKKVPGAAPGFVIYHENYSMMATPAVFLDEVR